MQSLVDYLVVFVVMAPSSCLDALIAGIKRRADFAHVLDFRTEEQTVKYVAPTHTCLNIKSLLEAEAHNSTAMYRHGTVRTADSY